MSYRGNRDIKQMTRNRNIYRINRLDPETSSKYVDTDDFPNVSVPRTTRSSLRGGNHRGGNRGRSTQQFNRQTAQVAKTGVQNAEIVHKVKVPLGAKTYDTKWIISMVHQNVENFKPILQSENVKGDFEFYVRNDDVAGAVRALSRRLYNRETKTKVEFYVNKVPAPWKKLSKPEVDAINAVIAKRYNAEQRMLDLSSFATDEDFTSQDMMMMLTKGNVMLAVANRIDEKYGSLTALSLSNNRLKFLDHASSLVPIAKFVKVLDLSNNMISSEAELKKLAGIPVEHLFFEGNPILEEVTTSPEYLSMVQRTFPKCSKLDGNDVTPLDVKPKISTDDIFPIRTGFHGPEPIPGIVKLFIEEFYDFYDGENGIETRKKLIQAYDENNSTFTLSIANLNGAGKRRYPNDESYSTYVQVTHNLMFQQNFGRTRRNRVAIGSMDIAVALSKLPITNHLKDSFVVDVFLNTESLVGFTVQGLFEDGRLSTKFDIPALNFFSRTFTVAPREGGNIAVISDQLLVSSASPERLERYKLLMETAEKNGPAPIGVSVTETLNQINGLGLNNGPSIEIKQQMVIALAQFSGMNRAYSEKCLNDLEWVYETACQKFIEFKDIIPAEAFVQ